MRNIFIKAIVISLFAITVSGCNGDSSADVSNSDNVQVIAKAGLQSVLDNAVSSDEAKNAYVTGILLSFQCKGFNNDQPVFLASGKLSDQSGGPDLPVDAIYQIGSETKSFVAVVALQLEAEGYLGDNGLDTTVGEVLDNPKASINWDESWNQVSLRQLLNMTSGIANCLNGEAFKIYSESPEHYFSIDELLSFAVNKPAQFMPGQGWEYSNTNYILMNKIISKISGIPLQEQITKRIINKLGLNHTYYVENLPLDTVRDPMQRALLMSGYYGKGKIGVLDYNTDLRLDSMSIYNSAGNLLSSSEDMNKYVRALFAQNGGLLEAKQLQELKYMVATQDTKNYKAGRHIDVIDEPSKNKFGLGYGLGVMGYNMKLPDGQSVNFYSHGGGSLGFSSNWIYLPDKQGYITYVINSQGPSVSLLRSKLDSQLLFICNHF